MQSFKDRFSFSTVIRASRSLPVQVQKYSVFHWFYKVFHLGRSFEGSGSYQGQFRVISGDEPANAFKTAVRHRKVEIGRSFFRVIQVHVRGISGSFRFMSGAFQVHTGLNVLCFSFVL